VRRIVFDVFANEVWEVVEIERWNDNREIAVTVGISYERIARKVRVRYTDSVDTRTLSHGIKQRVSRLLSDETRHFNDHDEIAYQIEG
jgi:ABC-type hemin transport system ATPase subunit